MIDRKNWRKNTLIHFSMKKNVKYLVKYWPKKSTVIFHFLRKLVFTPDAFLSQVFQDRSIVINIRFLTEIIGMTSLLYHV